MSGAAEKPRETFPSRGFSVSAGRLRLRPMVAEDLEEVLSIERASFSSPWSNRFFLEELRSPSARAVVAELDGRVVGYVIYWIVGGELDIHNLAVSPDHRRRGLGRYLLESVIDEAARSGCQRATLEVRVSNDAAQALYRALGFEVQGVRRGYYSDNNEDALVMARTIRGRV